jgi:hypothetical protein
MVSRSRIEQSASIWYVSLEGKKRGRFDLFFKFHYNNCPVNAFLEVSFDVWGTSWMMRIQIYCA